MRCYTLNTEKAEPYRFVLAEAFHFQDEYLALYRHLLTDKVMTRNVVIAFNRGYISRSLEDFEKLSQESVNISVSEIATTNNLIIQGKIKSPEISNEGENVRCFSTIKWISELDGEIAVSTNSQHFQSLVETSFPAGHPSRSNLNRS